MDRDRLYWQEKLSHLIYEALYEVPERLRAYFSRLRLLRRKVKWFFQRRLRGRSDFDIFELRTYLAETIADSVAEFRKDLNGYPAVLVGPEEWDEILKDIERGFRAKIEQDNLTVIDRDRYDEEYEKLEHQFQTAMSLFGTWFDSLWD